MRTVSLGFLLVFLPSCGLVKGWAVDAARDWADQKLAPMVEGQVSSLVGKEFMPAIRAQADRDKSGSVSLGEWWQWLIGGGGATVLLAWLRRKTAESRRLAEIDRLANALKKAEEMRNE